MKKLLAIFTLSLAVCAPIALEAGCSNGSCSISKNTPKPRECQCRQSCQSCTRKNHWYCCNKLSNGKQCGGVRKK